jgi:hypothetical protein
MLKKCLSFCLLTLFSLQAFADEGMWLPIHIKRLNQADMEKMGLQLTAEEIYSVNQSSLKDAIVSLGGFCTGEIISKEGLMLTNHHCAFESIQSHSSVKNDYLSNGFWAKTKEDEIPNEGLYARFLVKMEDVTKEVLKDVTPEMGVEERSARIQLAIQAIETKARSGTHYDANVKAFFEGNEYYLFIYETYNDVRLVGAPPSSIGKFGGDTDNWMWPRHTGDFALFRVYMSPDGKPADYSPENIPLKPKHHLPVSLEGVQEGDFTMVMGFPGSTERYLTSYGIDLALEQSNPHRVKIRENRLAKMREGMKADEEVRIKYAAKYAQVSNYWKYFIGQSEGLQKLNVADQKRKLEGEFQKWADSDPERQKIYGKLLANIQQSYDNLKNYNLSYVYLLEAVFGTEIIPFAFNFVELYGALSAEEISQEEKDAIIEDIREEAATFFKDYHAPTDQKVFGALMKLYFENVPAHQHPDIFNHVKKKHKGNFDKWAAQVFAKSFMSNEQKTEAFLKNPQTKVLEKDPAFIATRSIIQKYFEAVAPSLRAEYRNQAENNRLLLKGLREMQPDKKFYPDANSTLRFTYGQVGSYEPRDGVEYKFYTTLEGIMEKEDPESDEFKIPTKLRELYEAKDYGQYGENGQLSVGFISNNDITGGNSGSPVINGKGHLVGTAFDGNWEAMSGDIAFEPNLQRCISVDIRYTLFIIDKFAGASHLIDEMTLVKPEKVSQPEKAKIQIN